MAQTVKNLPAMQDMVSLENFYSIIYFVSLLFISKLTIAFLPGESHGRGSWWTIVHRVTKSWTWLSNYTATTVKKNKQKSKSTKSTAVMMIMIGNDYSVSECPWYILTCAILMSALEWYQKNYLKLRNT